MLDCGAARLPLGRTGGGFSGLCLTDRHASAALATARRERVAGGLGFEPRLTESESAVLPLNYSPLLAIRLLISASPPVRAPDIGLPAWPVHPLLWRVAAGRRSLWERGREEGSRSGALDSAGRCYVTAGGSWRSCPMSRSSPTSRRTGLQPASARACAVKPPVMTPTGCKPDAFAATAS